MLLIYIFLFATQFRLRTKAEQAMEAAGFMSATQLPKVAGGEEGKGGGGCHKVEGESGIPSWLWNYNYPYKYTSPARSTEFNVKLVVAAAAARGCHKSPSPSPFFFRSCPYFINIWNSPCSPRRNARRSGNRRPYPRRRDRARWCHRILQETKEKNIKNL